MSGHKETGKNEGDNSDEASMGLARTSPAGILAQRVSRKVELVQRLLQQEPATNALPAESLGLSAGTSRTFGRIDCVWCPPGQFVMGSPEDEKGRWVDEIQHTVTLTRGFWMAWQPTTQAEYKAVMGTNPSRFKGKDQYGNDREICSVETVSWNEAVEYCQQLTSQHRAQGILSCCQKWRLPTESEWEYAARAGGSSIIELPELLDMCDEDFWYPGAPGMNLGDGPNGWGLFEMIRNVSEWCSDWYAAYSSEPVTDPKGPITGKFRILRGDYWSSVEKKTFRFAFRNGETPDTRKDHIGFRPVLSQD